MFSSNDEHQNLELQHPDLPTIAHAVLVIMVGIGVLFFMGGMLTGLQNILLTRVIFLIVPVWACYMFQFDVRRTLFAQWPGWKSLIGACVGSAGMFIFLVLLENMLWNISALRPSPEDLEQFANQMELILDLDRWKVILLICVATPISEEILFRGFFLRSVKESLNIPSSILLVGIFFGVAHFSLIIKWIPLSLFGIYLGGVVWMSRSIVASTLIHAFHNTAVLITSGFSSGSVKPDSTVHQLDPMYQIVLITTSLLLIGLSLYLFQSDGDHKSKLTTSEQNLYKLFS